MTDTEDRAVSQFTAHATSYSKAAIVNDGDSLKLLLEALEPQPGQTILDLACGPGFVASALATLGASVIGVDLTPRMLDLAKQRSEQQGVAHLCDFRIGRMTASGLASNSVEAALSRYALHHAEAPEAVAAELVRVVVPGGRLVIVDMAASEDEEVRSAYDAVERYRDPSHVRNLTAHEVTELFEKAGCIWKSSFAYRLPADVDAILRGSHGPNHAAYRQGFQDSVDGHGLGVGARMVGRQLRFEYPIVGQVFEAPGQLLARSAG